MPTYRHINDAPPVAGLILAGGRARRMGGGDKTLRLAAGRSLLDRVVGRIRPQVATLLLSANGDPARFAGHGLPVLADCLPDHPGPLAGVLTGMEWLQTHRPEIPWLASVAGDTPLLPVDFVQRLLAVVEEQGADIGCASSGGAAHLVCALWPVRLAAPLRHAVACEELRKVGAWIGRYKVAHAVWPDHPMDPFFNVNTPAELACLEGWLAGQGITLSTRSDEG